MAYMILEIHDILPKRNATRSNPKNPISPQLIAPMIISVCAMQFSVLFPIVTTFPGTRTFRYLILNFIIVCHMIEKFIQMMSA